VSETGTAGACVDGTALDGATGVSVSPDGTSVYVASETSRAVAVFARDAATGAIVQLEGTAGCVSESGTGGACADGRALVCSTSLGPTTAGAFGLYADGSDVGLTADAHDLDAVELLSDGRLLVSTTGNASLPGATARDEDLLVFTPTSLGDLTEGIFSLSFDGSDVGLGDAPEDVDACAVDASGRIYLSTLDAFAVPGVSGQDEDVFVFTPTALDPPTTAGTYSNTLFFDGSSFGLGANDVFAIDLP
jgi:sugar lactone lactonase YvrE